MNRALIIILQIIGGTGMALTAADGPTSATIYCLTGNATNAALNLPGVKGSYTYYEPNSTKAGFPFQGTDRYGWTSGAPDAGGTSGWIPFAKGSLTGSTNDATWPWPQDTYIPRIREREIVIDLGQDYFIDQIELDPFKAFTGEYGDDTGKLFFYSYIAVLGKSSADERYTLLARINSNSPGLTREMTTFTVSNLASVMRHIKLSFVANPNVVGSIKGIHRLGFKEVRVFGREPHASETGIKHYQWRDGQTVPYVAAPQFQPISEPFVWPTPQEIKYTEERLDLTGGCRVLYAPGASARPVAEQMAEELREWHGVKTELAPWDKQSLKKGDILLMLGGTSAGIPELPKPAEQKEAYNLSVTREQAVIWGHDYGGLVYGKESLLRLVGRNGDYIRGAMIKDYPCLEERVLIESLSFGGGWGRSHSIRNIYRALGRGRINGIILDPQSLSRGPTAAALTNAIQYAADRNMRFILAIDMHPYATNYPECSPGDTNTTASAMARRGNLWATYCLPNPLQEDFYRDVFQEIDAKLTMVNSPYVFLYLWHLPSPTFTSWKVSKATLASPLNGAELFAHMINRINRHVRSKGCQLLIVDHAFKRFSEAERNIPQAVREIADSIKLIDTNVVVLCRNTEMARSLAKQGYAKTILYFEGAWENAGEVKKAAGDYIVGSMTRFGDHCGSINDYFFNQALWGRYIGLGSGRDNHLVAFAEKTWNPQGTETRSEVFAQRLGTATLDLTQQALGYHYPSCWKAEQREFFTVDIAPFCNLCHVDNGRNQGWLDFGSNYDLRHLPTGDVKLAGMPFRILAPDNGTKKTVIALTYDLPGARVAGIPIRRKAASLLFLNTSFKKGYAGNLRRAYGLSYYPNIRVNYADNTYVTVKLKGAVLDWCNIFRELGSIGYNQPTLPLHAQYPPASQIYHKLCYAFAYQDRPAWLGYTDSGDEVHIYAKEWVNPFPEKVITDLDYYFPAPDRPGDWTDIMLAITGTSVIEDDLRFWTAKGAGLLPDDTMANGVVFGGYRGKPVQKTAKPAGDYVPLLDTERGKFECTDKEQNLWLYKEKDREIAKITCKGWGFYTDRRAYQVGLEQLVQENNYLHISATHWTNNVLAIEFKEPRPVKSVALRTRLNVPPDQDWGISLTHPLLRADYEILVSADGDKFEQVGENFSVAGEDGIHYCNLDPPRKIKAVKIVLNPGPYINDYGYWAANLGGISHFQVLCGKE